MKLQRDGQQVDQNTYIKTSTAMKKMQDITDRLGQTTPQLNQFINADSVLKPQKQQQGQQSIYNKNLTEEENQKRKVPQTEIGPLKNEMTVVEWQKRCNLYKQRLEEQEGINNALEQDLKNRQDRFVKREIEYRKIIEDLQNELRSKSNLDINDAKRMEDLKELHGEINQKISDIQLHTSKILVDQERDIMRFFINKINEIKKEYEEERKTKGKKDQDYLEKESQLIQELDWIKNIAQKIDNENHTLMKKFMDLKAQYQTQENDREMLLKELIMKKKKNAILRSQLEQYEKLLNEVQKEAEDEQLDDKDDLNIQSPSQLNKEEKLSDNSQSFEKTANKKVQSMKNQSHYKLATLPGQQTSQQLNEGLERANQTIMTLQKTLKQEQRRVRQIKNLYIKEIEQKNELEKILRLSIDDIKEEILKVKSQVRVTVKKTDSEFNKEQRAKVIERLLKNEKVLTLIYDKTFYPDFKNYEGIEEANDNLNQQLYGDNRGGGEGGIKKTGASSASKQQQQNDDNYVSIYDKD